MSQQRYVVVVEWFDSAASLIRSYNLIYYLKDGTIQMFDLKNKRPFLKRSQYVGLKLKDIFIGAVLNIHSRQLKVVDYADEFTKSRFQNQRSKTLALIKPDCYLQMGKIINLMEEHNFTIGCMKLVKLNRQQGQKFYAEHQGKPYFNEIVQHITSDLVLAVELIADNAVDKWKRLLGPQQPKLAYEQHPNSIRALYGQKIFKNAAHGSQSPHAALKQLQLFFSDKSIISPVYCSNCSCLVIKPHIVTQGFVGEIIDAVLNAGFQISAMQMFRLNRAQTQQFLQVYKTVIPEYSQMVQQMTNGPCIAVEVRQDNVVVKLREFCGPHDPEMARTVRPKSLRAIYGKDKGKNAVHCTDLIEDGVLEVDYFFKILQK